MKRTILCAVLMLALAACGSTARPRASVPAHSPQLQPAVATSPAPGAAACAKLKAAAFPPAAYDSLVTRQVSRVSGGGTASKADMRAARTTVASWVRASCPQFAYLLRSSG